MLPNNDFGYLRYKEKHQTSLILKKALLFTSVLLSALCFFYITINAYYFIYEDKNSNIATLKSPPYPIKIIHTPEESAGKIENIDKAVYENIIGGKKEILDKGNIELAPIPKELMVPPSPLQEEIKRDITASQTPIKISQEESASNLPSKKHPNLGSKMIIYNAELVSKTSNQNDSNTKMQLLYNSSDPNSEMASLPSKISYKRSISRVQIAAANSSDNIYGYWQNLNKKHSALFSGLKHFIRKAELGPKGVLYQLQIGDFKDQISAEQFCNHFVAETGRNKNDCIIVE